MFDWKKEAKERADALGLPPDEVEAEVRKQLAARIASVILGKTVDRGGNTASGNRIWD
jgi:hypothetical protein